MQGHDAVDIWHPRQYKIAGPQKLHQYRFVRSAALEANLHVTGFAADAERLRNAARFFFGPSRTALTSRHKDRDATANQSEPRPFLTRGERASSVGILTPGAARN